VIDRPDRFLPMAAAAARIHALSNK